MASLRSLTAFKDRNGNVYPIPVPSGWVDHRVFAAATAETHTGPTGAAFVMVTPTVDAYVNLGGTAAVPAADVTDGTGSVLVPAGTSRLFSITPADATFSFIASAAGIVQLEFWS